MANRRYYQFRQALEPVVVDLFLHASFGSAGAVTLDANQSRGIASIVHAGAGTYAIHLQDNYNRLLMVSSLSISGAASLGPDIRLYNDSVNSSSDPSLTVVFSKNGTDADPASGEEVRMQITLKNSNA